MMFESRTWLIDANFPELMALINGAEGNTQALNWLVKYGFAELQFMALAADNDEEAMGWVMKNLPEELILITQKIQFVKNRIDADNNNYHKFNNT